MSSPFAPGDDYARRLLDAAFVAREEGDHDEADRLCALAVEE